MSFCYFNRHAAFFLFVSASLFPIGALRTPSKMEDEKYSEAQLTQSDVGIGHVADIINTSGHKQELDRNLGFWSICALSVMADNAWAAGGGSLV